MRESWWRSVGIGVGVGIALALFVYGAAILRFSSAGRGLEIPIVAGGIAAGCCRRFLDGDPAWLRRLLAFAVAGAAAFAVAWTLAPTFDRAPLRRWQLPGFSIGLPDADTVRQRNVDAYERGAVRVISPGGVVAVGWDVGDELDDESAMMFVDMMTGSFGLGSGEAREVDAMTVGGATARTFVVRTETMSLVGSFVPCGARQVSVMVGAESGEKARAMHRRIVASFHCTPDPAREATAQRPPPVAIDVPPGWEPTTTEPQQAAWEGDDGVVVFQYIPAGGDGGRKAAELMLAAMHVRITGSEPVGDRTLWLGEATMDGESAGVAAIVVPCGAELVLAMYFGDTSLPVSRSVLTSARCAAAAP